MDDQAGAAAVAVLATKVDIVMDRLQEQSTRIERLATALERIAETESRTALVERDMVQVRDSLTAIWKKYDEMEARRIREEEAERATRDREEGAEIEARHDYRKAFLGGLALAGKAIFMIIATVLSVKYGVKLLP